MRREDVEGYFLFLRRILREENVFYCLNRVEKWMAYNGKSIPVRFQEYPWVGADYDYLFRLSEIEMGRTMQPFFVRAVRLQVSRVNTEKPEEALHGR